jgi:hypothetical protein
MISANNYPVDSSGPPTFLPVVLSKQNLYILWALGLRRIEYPQVWIFSSNFLWFPSPKFWKILRCAPATRKGLCAALLRMYSWQHCIGMYTVYSYYLPSQRDSRVSWKDVRVSVRDRGGKNTYMYKHHVFYIHACICLYYYWSLKLFLTFGVYNLYQKIITYCLFLIINFSAVIRYLKELLDRLNNLSSIITINV